MVKIDVPFPMISNSRVRERVGRSSTINASPTHFSWNGSTPRVVVTGDSPDFDPTTIQHLKEEGFAVAYLPYEGDAKEYRNKLSHLADPLELGDKYAIVGNADLCGHIQEQKTDW